MPKTKTITVPHYTILPSKGNPRAHAGATMKGAKLYLNGNLKGELVRVKATENGKSYELTYA